MNWDEIRKEFETSKITLKALAEKHDIKIGTLKSRKSREGWSRDPTKKDATKKQKVASLEPVIESDDLTDKQKMFCLYYIKYFNATKAYQKAYECSYAVANVEGYRNLVKPSIKNEIERLRAERQQGVFLDGMAVLQKYIDIAFADITDFVEFGQEKRPELDHNLEPMIDENGDEVTYSYSYVNFKNSDEVDGTLITEVKKGKDGVSVKLADKMKALEFLSKYTDLLSDFDRKRLQDEKLKAETEFTQERTKLLKGTKKDTGMLESLIDAFNEANK
ncbi:terminase small subunit [Cytobacillus oceanisediminis]|uniref:terminase small subunit n=1 Tax=Cytobacillus oceanisediminis TaxID=665099 RepID=UPI001C23B108|nr:terminase small subunit [Cytobacillus oceanisediminis]MBU8773198.1 terminase small subunit [Cytobacillus oceanisediminis]